MALRSKFSTPVPKLDFRSQFRAVRDEAVVGGRNDSVPFAFQSAKTVVGLIGSLAHEEARLIESFSDGWTGQYQSSTSSLYFQRPRPSWVKHTSKRKHTPRPAKVPAALCVLDDFFVRFRFLVSESSYFFAGTTFERQNLGALSYSRAHFSASFLVLSNPEGRCVSLGGCAEWLSPFLHDSQSVVHSNMSGSPRIIQHIHAPTIYTSSTDGSEKLDRDEYFVDLNRLFDSSFTTSELGKQSATNSKNTELADDGIAEHPSCCCVVS